MSFAYRVFVPAFIVMAFTSVNDVRAARWSVGPQFHLNFADLRGDAAEGTDLRIGAAVRFATLARFNETLGIQAGVGFTQKGAKFSEQGIDGTIKLSYIELPVLLVAEVPTGEAAHVRFFGGPAFGVNVDAKAEGTVDIGFTELTETVSIDEYVTGSETGAVVGGGFAFAAGSAIVNLEGRWTIGLTDINDSPPLITVPQGQVFDRGNIDTIKNSVFSLGVWLEFPLEPGE